MTQHFHYFSPQTPTENRFDVDLGTSAIRLGDIPGWTTAAEDGDVGANGVAIDDPTSTAGYQNDGILGLKTFYVAEDACAAVGADGVNGQRLWTGYIVDREYRRGSSVSPSLIVGTNRRVDISLTDVNALAAFRVINASNTVLTGTVSKAGTTTITGSGTLFQTELAVGSTISIPGGGGTDVLYVSAIASDTSLTTTVAAAHSASGQVGTRLDGGRPAETDVQRVQWITSGVPAYFPVHNDAGYLNTSGPVNMDACDYTGQTPADVMHDCALASGKNWFVLYWEATGTDCVWYDFSESSTNYTSLLKLSNVLADVNGSDTFAYMPDLALKRSPSRTYAGLYMPFSGGFTYRTRAATANVYAWRDGTAPTSNVKTLAAANAVADRLLVDAASEDDRIVGKVQLPARLATGIKAGQRIQFKGSHLGFNASNTSYTDFTWMRVARLSVAQDEMTDQRYTMAFELTPQLAAGGTMLLAFLTLRDLGEHNYPTSIPAGWTQLNGTGTCYMAGASANGSVYAFWKAGTEHEAGMTWAWAGTTSGHLQLVRFSNVTGVDTTVIASNQGGWPGVPSPTCGGTLSVSPAATVGVIASSWMVSTAFGTTHMTAGGGQTLLSETAGDQPWSAAFPVRLAEYATFSGAGSFTPTANAANTNGNWAGIAVALTGTSTPVDIYDASFINNAGQSYITVTIP